MINLTQKIVHLRNAWPIIAGRPPSWCCAAASVGSEPMLLAKVFTKLYA